jgi:hypothetical protein
VITPLIYQEVDELSRHNGGYLMMTSSLNIYWRFLDYLDQIVLISYHLPGYPKYLTGNGSNVDQDSVDAALLVDGRPR